MSTEKRWHIVFPILACIFMLALTYFVLMHER